MHINVREAACGGIFILIGLVAAAQSLTVEIGTAFRMGPGYFPLVLAGCLILLGGIVALRSLSTPSEPFGPVAWRGMLLILPGPVLFALTVRGVGLVPAVALAAFVAAFASRRMSIIAALALALGLALFCYLVFSRGVGLSIRPFGPWLGF